MKIENAFKLSNVLWLVVIACVTGCWYHEYLQMRRYQPTPSTFASKQTWSGIFTYHDGGRAFQFSWINGRSVAESANYRGATTGFGDGIGIRSGTTVTATVAPIETATGTVWVAESIEDANRAFVSRTETEMYELWFTRSHVELFLRCLFMFVVIVSPFLIITGSIEAFRSGAFKRKVIGSPSA